MKTLILTSICLLCIGVNAQITKGSYLLGGNAGFVNTSGQTSNSEGESQSFSNTSLSISPNVGYFLMDKLAVGLQGNFGHVFGDTPSATSFGIGPMVRYYFLPVDKKINILAKGQYFFQTYKSEGSDRRSDNSIGFGAGPVFFLSKNIGLETTLDYSRIGLDSNGTNRFGLGIGFQIHF